MGEEDEISDFPNRSCSRAGVEDRVSEWEVGLPNADELTHLSHSLIPTELASAFRIAPEPNRSMLDVNQASQNTFSSLLAGGKGGGSQALAAYNKFKSFHDETVSSTMTDNLDMDVDDADLTREGSDSRKTRRAAGGGSIGEADYANAAATTTTNNESNNWNENGGDDGSARTLKRPRLVWTPELHKRFVEVVAHLGIKNAVPKTIMQHMNVEGLSRENVASHLQKYRLYVKRMEGQSTEESPSDNLHESDGGSGQVNGNVNGNGLGNGHIAMPFPMPYPPPAAHMIPVIRMPGETPGSFYDSHHHQNHNQFGMVQQQMDYYHYYPVAPSDK